jgi:hypothetical protein
VASNNLNKRAPATREASLRYLAKAFFSGTVLVWLAILVHVYCGWQRLGSTVRTLGGGIGSRDKSPAGS